MASGLQGLACFLVPPLTLDPPSLLAALLARSDILYSGQNVSENNRLAHPIPRQTGKEAQGMSWHRLRAASEPGQPIRQPLPVPGPCAAHLCPHGTHLVPHGRCGARRTCEHMGARTRVFTYIVSHRHTFTHTLYHMYIYSQSYTYAHVHTVTHIPSHMYTHIHCHTLTHTHTYSYATAAPLECSLARL